MSKLNPHQKSKNRLDLFSMSRELSKLATELVKIQVITKGTVYTQVKKCGNRNCKCARGQYHSMKVHSVSHEGKTRLKSLSKYPILKLSQLEKQTKNYRQFRQVRAKITVCYKKLLKAINTLEQSITTDKF